MLIDKLRRKYSSIPIQVKASFWFLICSFLQKAISMITTPIFTRLMTPDEYGQFNVFNSWLGIATIIISLNLSSGVYTQGLVKYETDRPVFSSALQGLSITIIGIWVLIYLFLQNYWNRILSLSNVQILAMFVLIWTTAVFNFWATEQRVEYKYRALVILTLTVSLLKPLISILFVSLSKNKVVARILGIVLVELLCYTGLFAIQMRRGKQFYSRKYWKYALLYNLPLIPHYLSQVVLSSADRIMISNLVDDAAAGVYSLAYSVSSIMTLFNTALMQTLNPWIYQKIKAKRIEEIKPIAYISLLIIAIVNLILILFAPEIIQVFAPRSYYSAIYVIPPIVISVYYMFSYDLYAKFAFYYEKSKQIMLASVIGAILNIVLNDFFIRKYGFLAAGYTTLACYIIYSIAHYFLMNRVCKLHCDGMKPYDYKIIMLISVPFTLFGLLMLWTYKFPFVRYGIALIITFVLIANRTRVNTILKRIVGIRRNRV